MINPSQRQPSVRDGRAHADTSALRLLAARRRVEFERLRQTPECRAFRAERLARIPTQGPLPAEVPVIGLRQNVALTAELAAEVPA